MCLTPGDTPAPRHPLSSTRIRQLQENGRYANCDDISTLAWQMGIKILHIFASEIHKIFIKIKICFLLFKKKDISQPLFLVGSLVCEVRG